MIGAVALKISGFFVDIFVFVCQTEIYVIVLLLVVKAELLVTDSLLDPWYESLQPS